MNRALLRLLRRATGIASEEALARAIRAAAEAAPRSGSPPELAALLAGLGEVFDKVGSAYDQFDRDLDLRTRSLELASAELVGANERLREKYADLYQNAPVMLQSSDPQSRLTDVNDYWLARLGYARHEVIGRPVADFLAPASLQHMRDKVFPEFRRTGISTDVPCQMVRKDGTVIDVLISAFFEKDDRGVPVRSLAAIVDVTERTRIERLRGALHEISEAAHAAADLATLLRRIHGIIGDLLPAGNFFVALLDEAAGELRFPYFIDEHDAPPRARKLGAGGLTETVIRTGRSLRVTPDTLEDARAAGGTIPGTLAVDWLGVPLKCKGRTIGALAVQSYAGSVRYTPQDEALLQFVSEQVASAIDRLQSLTDLRHSEERLQRALEASRLALWDYDVATGSVYLSEAWATFLGGEPQPTVTTFAALAGMVPEEDRAAVWEAIAPALKGEKPNYSVEHRLRTPAGNTIWILSQGRVIERDAAGRALRAVGTNKDITDRKQAEEELRLAALVYQHSSEAMLVTDGENRIIAINPAFTQLTGYTAEEALGRTPRLLKSGRQPPSFYADMWRELQAKGHWQGEIWNRHKSGREFAEEVVINVIRGADGTVQRHVALFSDITQKKESENLIWHQANYDALTGLPNRRMFRDRLEHELRKAGRDGTVLAILMIDLDRFKEVNDTLGHDTGDALLAQAARRIRDCVRASDTVARQGGDEFTVILPEIERPEDVQFIAQKILAALAEAFPMGMERMFISASIGITLYPNDAKGSEDLIKNSDQALYAAKNAGRGRFSHFTPALQTAALARMRLTNDMRQALEEKQFTVQFQPVVSLSTGRVLKAESLIRWRHPTRGFISPSEFIPLAEASGMVVDIGAWMFREAARWVRRWREAGHADFQVSVNQSPREFQREGYSYSEWVGHLDALGLPGRSIVVEITEGLLLDASDEVKAKLLQLRDAGIEVALDDFGVGYSSLSYLKNLDIDYLKIDQSFTRNLAPGSSDMALCEAIVVMAHKLGLTVIAEGVETTAQRDLLQSIGCDFAQGYFFAQPMPGEDFEKYLATNPVIL
jgi:diguanylate cyclase (GGDEF)-like protein/PAS domain S-box-containing protein